MEILVFTAIQGRQKITELFLMGVERLKLYSGHNISLFCVVSDQADIDFLKSKGVDYCVHENTPLSDKFDYGFKQAIKKKFDYLLTLGSDDLIDHNIFKDHYNALMQSGNEFFGLKQIGILDSQTLDCSLYQYFMSKSDMLLGAGRMLSYRLCQEFKDKPLYNLRKKNNGLDYASENELKKIVKPTFVKTNKIYLIDVKSDVNIWSYKSLSRKLSRVEYDKLTHFLSIEEDNYLRVSNYKIVAVIPVHGRLPLLKLTIERLYKKNKVHKVICIGSENEKNTCLHAGADFIEHENKPLGRKWNAGFQKAKMYEPDAVLFVGSSDWISDNWIDYMAVYLKDFDLIGKPDFNLVDYGHQLRACHWPGYTDHRRANEPIGIGRLISARVLNKMNWQPMEDKLDSSLDWSMYQKVLNLRGNVKLIKSDSIQSLSLSTHQWENKHKFEDHWRGKLPSKKIDVKEMIDLFPEIKRL